MLLGIALLNVSIPRMGRRHRRPPGRRPWDGMAAARPAAGGGPGRLRACASAGAWCLFGVSFRLGLRLRVQLMQAALGSGACLLPGAARRRPDGAGDERCRRRRAGLGRGHAGWLRRQLDLRAGALDDGGRHRLAPGAGGAAALPFHGLGLLVHFREGAPGLGRVAGAFWPDEPAGAAGPDELCARCVRWVWRRASKPPSVAGPRLPSMPASRRSAGRRPTSRRSASRWPVPRCWHSAPAPGWWRSGELTVGQLTAFTMLLGQLIWPMFAAGWVLSLLERGRAAWTRLQPVLQAQASPSSTPARRSRYAARRCASPICASAMVSRPCSTVWTSSCNPAACWPSSARPGPARRP